MNKCMMIKLLNSSNKMLHKKQKRDKHQEVEIHHLFKLMQQILESNEILDKLYPKKEKENQLLVKMHIEEEKSLEKLMKTIMLI